MNATTPPAKKKATSKKKVTAKKAVATKKKTATKKAPVKKKATTKKAPVKKKTATKKGVAAKTTTPSVSNKDRYEMISTMAYYRSEKRGFEPGHAIEDWLACERLVDEMISKA